MKQSILNPVLLRWLKDQPELIPAVDCVRCTLALERPQFSGRWSKFKCCTFQPFVSCFMAGAMLQQGMDPLAIDAGKAVLLPIGVVATAVFRERLENTPEDRREDSLLCSYYDRELRRCKVWALRPGECSLHFCATTKAAEREALSRQVFALESAIAQMALVHLGFDPKQVAAQVDQLNSPSSTHESLSTAEARSLYTRAWEWVEPLEASEVLSWLDSRDPAL